MAGFAIRTSFAGHTSNSVKAADELTYDLDHLVGAGQFHLLLPSPCLGIGSGQKASGEKGRAVAADLYLPA